MKRSGVRTRTLGAGWEERFLEAVRKAREQKLIAPDAAEKLRLLAGVYFCSRCKKEHRTESRLGKEHLRLRPKAAEPAPPGTKDGAKSRKGKASKAAAPLAEEPLPVALTKAAKASGKAARAKLEPAEGPAPQSPPAPPPGKRRGLPPPAKAKATRRRAR